MDWELPAARVFPVTVAVPNPEMAPTFVPMSPVIVDAPLLVRAPFAVKSAKLEAVPKFGICPKPTVGQVNSITDAR
ncbi:hypothetical protein GCM10027190_00740 [Spirosoma areae]